MDQTNPLAEITHKRRLSSLGPGGIGRDQAGFAVREIHPSHFGRICPIETPEGPNAGLVGSLASYCRITEDGFLQSPYFSSSSISLSSRQLDLSPSGYLLTNMLPGHLGYAGKAGGKQPNLDVSGNASVVQPGRAGSASPNRDPGGRTPVPLNSSTPQVGVRQEISPEWFLFLADVEDESYICSENLPGEAGAKSSGEFHEALVYGGSALRSASGASPAASPLGVHNENINKFYPIRYKQEFLTVQKNQIQFFSVSPIQMISLATSLIPFLEHDDANRALMGSNMQRQAVPILFAEKPLVGTGLEIQAARDSSTTLLAKKTGQVIYVDASEIIVKSSSPRNGTNTMATPGRSGSASPNRHPGGTKPNEPGKESFESYKLQNYWRSNQNTCLRQRPQVRQGEWVEKGDLLADGSATQHGEIALGKNILLAYMPWEGYNFEDAIVINERLVQEDIYTSIHIDRYDIEIRETQYGKEKITRDLPYINIEQIRNIDHQGIIYPGTWVEEGDILVGKITPISPPKPTPEYRLLLAIFETKPLPFKETSLRVPQGVEGRVLDCIVESSAFNLLSSSSLGDVPVQSTTGSLFGEAEPARPGDRLLNMQSEFTSGRSVVLRTDSTSNPELQLSAPTSQSSLLAQSAASPQNIVPMVQPPGTGDEMALRAGNPQSSEPSLNQQNEIASGKLTFESHGLSSGGGPESSNSFGASDELFGVPVSRSAVTCLAGGAPKRCTPNTVLSLTKKRSRSDQDRIEKVQIFLAHKRKIQLGDKMSGRHGNKGIVSLILPPQDMPFLQDGTSIDIVLNPLGVPSRMNVGQVLECLFGLAGYYLKQQYRLLPFDEMYGKDASRGLVYQKLYEASCRIGYDWLFDPNSPGKSHLFDGRTGEAFHQPILVGYSYMFKLIHLVDEKMHARSTGPYSLVTQQPLGGRSKHGGQRLGEMEVWALEGFGAASILQEFLTVKSDEIYARNTFLFHLMKRRKLPRPGLPESFRVLVHELQSLCLSVYYNPDFRLTYPSLIGWDGLFLLSSKKFPTLQQISHLKNI